MAPQTASDSEFHKVAGTNVRNQHKVITAYDNLRECWDYYVEDKKSTKK